MLLLPHPACMPAQTALIREATLMKKFNHPGVLPLYAAFVAGRELWFVTPFMASAGSAGRHRHRHMRRSPVAAIACLTRGHFWSLAAALLQLRAATAAHAVMQALVAACALVGG